MNDTQSGHKVESFVFYRSFYEALNGLRSGTKLALYDAICEYCLNGRIPEMPETAKPYFTLILPQLQANLRRREVGKLGGRPAINRQENTQEKKPMVSESENLWLSETKTDGYADGKPNANVNVNVNDNENANANLNVNVNAAAAGTPTLEEIEEYAKTEGIKVDCRRFYEYFSTPDEQGRTWMDTKGNPVGGNWRRKLRSWANLEQMQAQTKQARQAKDRNTLNNYKVEGKGVADLSEIAFDVDEL